MTMPADPTPADARALAEEAIRLAEAAPSTPWSVGPRERNAVYGADEWMVAEAIAPPTGPWPGRAERAAALIAHAGTHYAPLARALLAALDEREAMLADLPHALGRCRCELRWGEPEPTNEAHTAAIARLEARGK